MKPIIGITRCSRVDDYVASVQKAGGDPLVLEPTDDPGRSVDRIDALLLTGGLDVDPARYGEDRHPSTEVDAVRDRFEMPLSKRALAGDVPVFAICRGVQVLNVAAGGTLTQDIPTAVPTTLNQSILNHSINGRRDEVAHEVRVVPGSKLASTLGGALETSGLCRVNSRHHQAVAKVAPSFVASATSPDGVIEAIERPAATFCVGVQWHPENYWRTGEFDELFRAFVEAARKHREQVSRTDRH